MELISIDCSSTEIKVIRNTDQKNLRVYFFREHAWFSSACSEQLWSLAKEPSTSTISNETLCRTSIWD